MADLFPTGGADIDPTEVYRYRLWRELGGLGPTAVFTMLNPSTAGADSNDPSIRRCIGFADRLRCCRLMVVNMYAYRATDPRELRYAHLRGVDIIGPDNDAFLKAELAAAGAIVIAAWGALPVWMQPRARCVERYAEELGVQLHALATTKDGHPRHPLYLRRDLDPAPWTP